MSLSVAVRIARREMRGGLAGFRVFLACLVLAIAAIAAVGSVRESIRAGLAREGASLLGGDAEVELTYRFATPEERAALDALGEVSEIVEFRSMAVVGSGGEARRALTEVKGVDGAYPFYGAVTLDPPMPLAQAFAGQGGLPGAVMDPVLVERLGLAPGDSFALGTGRFVLMAAITSEPDNAVSGFDIGPRSMVLRDALEGSGLLQAGTLFDSKYRLLFAPGTDLDRTEAATAELFAGKGHRWHDRRDGAPGVSRFVERLSAFLVLVGLAGLAVGGVGVATAVRAHLEGKTATIATLKSLGADGRTIFQIYMIQVGAVTLLGTVLGVALGAAMPLALAPLIEQRLPVPAELGLHPAPLAEAAIYGLLAAAIFTLWPLSRARDIRAAALWRDAAGQAAGWPKPRYILATSALVIALVALAATLSGMAWLTIYAALGVLGAFVALLAVAALVRAGARRLARRPAIRGHSALRLALGAIGGPRSEAGPVILSLGLGLSVLAAVGQIDTNLRGAITGSLPEVAPSYFMIDIQPDQIDGFTRRLTGDPGVSKLETAPMLRGVISRINGRPAAEVGGDHWVLRGDRGVTYSAAKPEGTRITAGRWWPEDYDGPPQISFASEEAAEIGLTLGDRLTVNILGRDIEGEITSLRDVDFSTGGIGFVMAMNPGALAGAPHTSIATIHSTPEAEGAILRDISDAYPNITAIRVRDAIEKVAGVLAGVAAAVTYGALATLVTGAVVLVGTAAAGLPARLYEAAILRTLGASRRTLLVSFALRWALLGAAAGLVAVAAGGVAGWAVSRFVMETGFRFAPGSALLIVAGGMAATLLAGLGFAWHPLAARPARTLRASE